MPIPSTALLVDDEAHIRRYLGLILKGLGVTRVLEASTGDEAVAVFTQEKPPLVLLDINMPGRSGLETLPDLRAVDPDAVIIMLTSLNTRQIVEESAQLGASGYIRKDTPRDEIVRLLQEHFPADDQPPAP